MIFIFAAVTIALLAFALRDEFRPGESLFPGFDGYYDAELIELPVHEGWEPEDVARTLAEIETL